MAPILPSAHTAGIYADMTLDGPEIGTLVVVVDRARNLPNRKSMGKQDPYCAMRLGKEARKTSTDMRGGQTPKWDQELRFTVHEAPDYYQLKISIFNDDKKSELIGEGWVDLKEVVIPGGGQNDLWHPLQYRGKYAGDIRIELTYYDIRPRDESVIEKRRESERQHSNSRNNTPHKTANPDGPRHFGPRDIARRPLPADPIGSSPLPSRPSLPEHPHSSPGPYAAQPHDHQQTFRDSWHPPHQGTLTNPATPNHNQYQSGPYDFTLPPRGQELELSQHSDYADESFHSTSNYPDQGRNGSFSDLHDNDYNSTRSSYQPQPLPLIPQVNRYDDRRHSAQASFPDHDQNYHTSSPYGSSPPVQPPFPGPSDIRQRAQFNRYSTSPIKNDIYRDSPLRQSMSQSHFEPTAPSPPHDYLENDAPPPPPPAHRHGSTHSLPRPSHSTNTSPVPIPEPLQIGPTHRQMSLDDRSPLQNIERQYDPRAQPRQSQSPLPNPSRGFAAQNTSPVNQSYSNRPRPRAHSQEPARSPEDLYTRNPYSADSQRRSGMSTSPIPMDRETEIYGPGGRGCQPNYNDPNAGMRTSTAGVPIVRPRAISPDARVPTRKSVSPRPSMTEEKNFSGIPFSPDSYDVFNPSSVSGSALSGSEERYENPDQAMEAARMKEVQKLREQGPIIGNDGRVIDPSDHLPTDTWAPEPERKKKPEVVIRFKTGGTPRTSTGYGSSPALPNRPKSMVSPVFGSSPSAVPVNQSPLDHSPVRTGRNRLQKTQQPPRPGQAPGFAHTHSSPSVPISSPVASSPMVDALPRHSVSEYPLREHQNYGNGFNSSPRTPAYATGPPPVPAKVPIQAGYSSPGYNRSGGYGPVDALAAEMNSIDIGVGSGGRAPRTRRNY